MREECEVDGGSNGGIGGGGRQREVEGRGSQHGGVMASGEAVLLSNRTFFGYTFLLLIASLLYEPL